MYCCKIMCLQRLYMIRPRNRVNAMISIIKHDETMAWCVRVFGILSGR